MGPNLFLKHHSGKAVLHYLEPSIVQLIMHTKCEIFIPDLDMKPTVKKLLKGQEVARRNERKE